MNTSLALSNFRYWAEGEPNDGGGKENSVEIIVTEDPLRSWNDVHSDRERMYICEKAM